MCIVGQVLCMCAYISNKKSLIMGLEELVLDGCPLWVHLGISMFCIKEEKVIRIKRRDGLVFSEEKPKIGSNRLTVIRGPLSEFCMTVFAHIQWFQFCGGRLMREGYVEGVCR